MKKFTLKILLDLIAVACFCIILLFFSYGIFQTFINQGMIFLSLDTTSLISILIATCVLGYFILRLTRKDVKDENNEGGGK